MNPARPHGSSRLVGLGFGALFTAFGLLVAGIGMWTYLAERSEERRLDAGGKFTNAVVLHKFIRAVGTGSNAWPSYRIQFRFTPDGDNAVTDTADVNAAAYDRVKPGGTVEVVYLPAMPSVHRVEGEMRVQGGTLVAAFGGLFALIGGGTLFGMLRRRRVKSAPGGTLAHLGAWLFFGVWFIVGLVFLMEGFGLFPRDRATQALFVSESASATGIVQDKSIVEGWRRTRTEYRVTFSFKAQDGDEIVAVADLDSSAWDRLIERGPIMVTYVASQPWRYRVEGQSVGSLPIGGYVFLALGTLFMAVGGGGLAYALRKSPKRPRARRIMRRVRRWRAAAVTTSVPQVSLPARVPWVARVAQSLPAGWFVKIFGTIFFLAFMGGAFGGLGMLIDELQYARRGAVADGRIAGKFIERASRTERSPTRHVLSYRFFTAQGKRQDGRLTVGWQTWQTAKAGDRIAVRYRVDAPQINREAAKDGSLTALFGSALAIVLAGISGAIVFLSYYADRRHARLMREGFLALATVVAVEDTSVVLDETPQKRVRFRFRDAAGREREARSALMPASKADRWKPGDVGEIRCDPNNPDDHVWLGKRRARSAA